MTVDLTHEKIDVGMSDNFDCKDKGEDKDEEKGTEKFPFCEKVFNSSLACRHNSGIDPTKISDVKIISEAAFKKIVGDNYDVDWHNTNSICSECDRSFAASLEDKSSTLLQ